MQQFMQVDSINTVGRKRKASTASEGLIKRPARASNSGTQEDTTFSRENGKLVIMVARTIWSALMGVAIQMGETRAIFGMPIAWSAADSPTATGNGPRHSDKTRLGLRKMHMDMMYGTLIQFGLQGCRVQQQPTFEPGESYSPTHVYPPGSDDAVFVTPSALPTMPVAGDQYRVTSVTPPTPTFNRATVRKAAAPAKSRVKKGAAPSVCIPDIQQGENGVTLNLGTGIEVPVSGLSKNQLKKMARQTKQDGPGDDAAFAAALQRGDYEAATKQFDNMKGRVFPASAPSTGLPPALRIPPPRAPKPPQSCKKIRDALAEGERRVANGEVRLPPTRGSSKSAANNGAQVQGGPVPPQHFSNMVKSNSSPGQPTFASNAANSNSSPGSFVNSSPIFPSYQGGSHAQQPQQGSVNLMDFNSEALDTTQEYNFDDDLPAQMQQDDVEQPIDPQLYFGFDGQAPGSREQPSTPGGHVQKENQQPAPASMDELLKTTGMPQLMGQQGQDYKKGQSKQPRRLGLSPNAAGVEALPMNGTGQQGQVNNHGQFQQPALSTNVGQVASTMQEPVATMDNQAHPRGFAQPEGLADPDTMNIDSWNGMLVINNEIQTDGYGMQPLAVVMPPGTGPAIETHEQAAPANVKTKSAETQARQSYLEDLFGEDFSEFMSDDKVEEDPLAALTEADLIAVRMENIDQRNAVDAALLASLEAFNRFGAIPQSDGTSSPVVPPNRSSANLSRDPSGTTSSSVRADRAAQAQKVYLAHMQQAQAARSTAPPPTAATQAQGPGLNPNTGLTPQQIAAQEAHRNHVFQTTAELTARRAQDSRRNQYLAAGRDLPSQAEREKRARRKQAHERLAELRYITAEARVFPKGSSYRVGFEESIEEMVKLEGEIVRMGDKVLKDSEYAVVRREGYDVHQHWMPEEK
jgi:hypothetical protein